MHVLTAVFMSTFAMGGAPSGELLDFTAKWCGPCQQMGPIVDRLHRQGYPVRKVDIDENRELARKYNIQSIPAFVLIVNGKVVEQTVGQQSERALIQMLAKIPKPEPEFDPQVAGPVIIAKNTATGQSNNTRVVPPIAPNWLPLDQPKRGLLGSLRRNPPTDTRIAVADTKSTKTARGKLDDQPLQVDEVLARSPLEASVRIRISDKEGTDLGSGTIIQSRTGHTLILTCGHTFRNFNDNSMVEVDVFVDGKKEVYVGKHIKHDLGLDLGLISIPTDNPLPFARVASGNYQVTKGNTVVSVGCGQGNNPSEQQHFVTGVNRYKGPSSIECTGAPVQGRSGGGLFNKQGEVVGVCVGADDRDERGFYIGLPAVQGFLKSCDLADLLLNGLSPGAELEQSEDAFVAESNEEPAQPALRGVEALQAALGEGFEGVICVVKSEKDSIKGQRVVVLTSKE